MKRTITALIFFMLFLSYSLIKPSSNISYVESSTGLDAIQFESGRTEVEIADINKDGYNDFLSIGDHGNPNIQSTEEGIMVWFGNGTGSNWSAYKYGNFGYGGIAIGDVNNDGKNDVGYGMHHNYSSTDLGNQILEVALGDGSGMNWTAWDDSLATNGETWGMFSTDFADVDNDGLLDIGSVSFGCCAGVHVYKNLGNGQWVQTFGFIGGNSSMDFVFGDMNNDGNIDFAVAHQNGTPYFGDGTGNFTLKHNNLPAPGNMGFKGISLGDVNNDGLKELSFVGSGGSLNVWKWNNANLNWDNLSADLPTSGNYSATQLYDMNNDGYEDLIAFGGAVVTIWAGNGGTNWSQILTFVSHASPGNYSDFSVGDVDNNGFADIVILAAEQQGLFNYINKLKFFKETTPYSTLSITPLYPKNNEIWRNNSVKFIEWISSAPQAIISKVKLELSTNGNAGPWSLIADSLPNNGKYQWIVPAGIQSENCLLKHTVFLPSTGQFSVSQTQSPFKIGNYVSGVFYENNKTEKFIRTINYPNPFNQSTIIRFESTIPGNAVLNLYNIEGRKIAILYKDKINAGVYEVKLDSDNLASGVYFYRLTLENSGRVYEETKKITIIK